LVDVFDEGWLLLFGWFCDGGVPAEDELLDALLDQLLEKCVIHFKE